RQLVNELTPRVLPWAIFPLGLRPVCARNIGCCTFCRVIFFLELRPVCARNIGCCTFRWIIFFLVLRPLIACIVAAARCHIYHYNLV
ncbi:hypothetical protein, partial [Hoylesella timonensis]|uniref:hypothetical protein n=1 Tax=Hoylesella timonensis TaxID=386414 RepID=UPI001CA4FEC6